MRLISLLGCLTVLLLIVPEGIEMMVLKYHVQIRKAFNRTRRN